MCQQPRGRAGRPGHSRRHRPPQFHIPSDGSIHRAPAAATTAHWHCRNHINWAHRLTGRFRSCKPAIRVQFPVGPLASCAAAKPVPWSNGDDIWLTTRKRWFDSIRDHLNGLCKPLMARCDAGLAARLSISPTRVRFPSASLGFTAAECHERDMVARRRHERQRKAAGYGWPGRTANACLRSRRCGFESHAFRLNNITTA